MTQEQKKEMIQRAIKNQLFDWLYENHYKIDQEDLFDIAKELAEAIASARDVFNEAYAYRFAIENLKNNVDADE